MTNYNDGKWHGWNGGECPLNKMTKVDVVFDDGHMIVDDLAWEPRAVRWTHEWSGRKIVAFRVTKEYKEPREYWICQPLDGGRTLILDKKPPAIQFYRKVIHVREVVE